jgi:hypothetical protein
VSDFASIKSSVKKTRVKSILTSVVCTSTTVDYLDTSSPATTGSTITLDFNTKIQRIFLLGTIASSKTIAISNSSAALVFLIRLNVTGALSFTFPSTFRAQTAETRWTNGTKILLLTGATATPFEISCTWDGTFWALKASTDYSLT